MSNIYIQEPPTHGKVSDLANCFSEYQANFENFQLN